MFEKLKEHCASYFKKLLQKQSETFLNTKFNIQIYSSYQVIFAYIDKVSALSKILI